jgi:hypothetical protein
MYWVVLIQNSKWFKCFWNWIWKWRWNKKKKEILFPFFILGFWPAPTCSYRDPVPSRSPAPFPSSLLHAATQLALQAQSHAQDQASGPAASYAPFPLAVSARSAPRPHSLTRRACSIVSSPSLSHVGAGLSWGWNLLPHPIPSGYCMVPATSTPIKPEGLPRPRFPSTHRPCPSPVLRQARDLTELGADAAATMHVIWSLSAMHESLLSFASRWRSPTTLSLVLFCSNAERRCRCFAGNRRRLSEPYADPVPFVTTKRPLVSSPWPSRSPHAFP